jgi:hypothetical protein
LAYNTSQYLHRLDYKIISQGNALNQNYQTTMIYDLSNGQKPVTLEGLKEIFKADSTSNVPSEIQNKYLMINPNTNNNYEKPDILVVLGLDNIDRFKIEEPLSLSQLSSSTASTTDANLLPTSSANQF